MLLAWHRMNGMQIVQHVNVIIAKWFSSYCMIAFIQAVQLASDTAYPQTVLTILRIATHGFTLVQMVHMVQCRSAVEGARAHSEVDAGALCQIRQGGECSPTQNGNFA